LLAHAISSATTQLRHSLRSRVAIPSSRSASFNVAVAASIIMYDRHAKQHAPEQLPSVSSGGAAAAAGAVAEVQGGAALPISREHAPGAERRLAAGARPAEANVRCAER